MEWFREFVHTVVAIDVVVVGVVFFAGAAIAPIAILVGGACRWRRRLKWAAVALLTSWFGLWLFRREQAQGSAARSKPSAARAA